MSFWDRLPMFCLLVIGIPGAPFALLIAQIKRMGDGSGNESSTIEFYAWSLGFGLVIWAGGIWGINWLWSHLSISFV